MLTPYFRNNLYTWQYTTDPDSSVQNSFGSFADFGDTFINLITQDSFMCTIGGTNQTWQRIPYINQILQSNWTQSNSSSQDFIKNKPASRSQSSASRSLNSGFQISTTRDSLVNYSVDISCSLTLVTGQSGTVFLEIASDSGFTTNLQELGRFTNANTGTLAVGLALTQSVTGTVSGYVPPAYYCRLRSSNNTGTPTFNYRSGQEVLL